MIHKHDADDCVPLVKEEMVIWRMLDGLYEMVIWRTLDGLYEMVIWRMFDGLYEIGRSYGMKMNVEKNKNEMGGACSAYGGRGEAYTGFYWGNLRERDHLGDPGVDRRTILRWIVRKKDVGYMD